MDFNVRASIFSCALSPLVMSALLVPIDAVACTVAGSYVTAGPPTGFYVPRESFTPSPPKMFVSSVSRGDQSGGGPCLNFGSVHITMTEGVHPDILGYRFKLVTGNLPNSTFPDEVVRPASTGDGNGFFRFLWGGGAGESTPIDARVEVRAIARDGVEGDPVILRIGD